MPHNSSWKIQCCVTFGKVSAWAQVPPSHLNQILKQLKKIIKDHKHIKVLHWIQKGSTELSQKPKSDIECHIQHSRIEIISYKHIIFLCKYCLILYTCIKVETGTELGFDSPSVPMRIWSLQLRLLTPGQMQVDTVPLFTRTNGKVDLADLSSSYTDLQLS